MPITQRIGYPPRAAMVLTLSMSMAIAIKKNQTPKRYKVSTPEG